MNLEDKPAEVRVIVPWDDEQELSFAERRRASAKGNGCTIVPKHWAPKPATTAMGCGERGAARSTGSPGPAGSSAKRWRMSSHGR